VLYDVNLVCSGGALLGMRNVEQKTGFLPYILTMEKVKRKVVPVLN
jgi:hypothetical protein